MTPENFEKLLHEPFRPGDLLEVQGLTLLRARDDDRWGLSGLTA